MVRTMMRRMQEMLSAMKAKKGQMTMEAGISQGLMFVVLVIAIGIGATILAGIQTGQTAGSVAANVSAAGLTGLTNFSGQFGNVGLVLAAALILSILVIGLGMFFRRPGQ